MRNLFQSLKTAWAIYKDLVKIPGEPLTEWNLRQIY